MVMAMTEVTLKTRARLPETGEIYTCNPQTKMLVIGEPRAADGVTACMIVSNNVNATNLSLRTFERTDLKCVDRMIIIDDASQREKNYELAVRFLERRGEGVLLRVKSPLNHHAALQIIVDQDLVHTPYLLTIDSDVEVKSGVLKDLVRVMKESGEDQVYGVGEMIPSIKMTVKGPIKESPVREWTRRECIHYYYTLFNAKVWLSLAREYTISQYWDYKTGRMYDTGTKMYEEALR